MSLRRKSLMPLKRFTAIQVHNTLYNLIWLTSNPRMNRRSHGDVVSHSSVRQRFVSKFASKILINLIWDVAAKRNHLCLCKVDKTIRSHTSSTISLQNNGHEIVGLLRARFSLPPNRINAQVMWSERWPSDDKKMIVCCFYSSVHVDLVNFIVSDECISLAFYLTHRFVAK